jgi:3-keto-L-gulonate-6-phosphate decarboxylase
VDQAAVHPAWREVAWEIREGENPQKALEWLEKLGVDYLVVHTFKSLEFYHDFSNPEKFEGVEGLEKVYDEGGDRIYKIN